MLQVIFCADEGVATSTSTSAMPGHGAAALHWNSATCCRAVPRTGPHVTSEIWNVDVSHPPDAPLKLVHCVMKATSCLRSVTLKSRNAAKRKKPVMRRAERETRIEKRKRKVREGAY